MSAETKILPEFEGKEDLVFMRGEDGSYRGWRVDLLLEKLSSKVEEKLLLCSCCNGLLRNACFYQEKFRCGVCIPEGISWQPVEMNRIIVNEKMICCPLKNSGCNWTDSLSKVELHLGECEFLPELCPLGCASLEGEREGKVLKLERRLLSAHKRDSCPLREQICEFCSKSVKACQMNPHLEVCNDFLVLCPNRCVIEGEGVTKQVKRRDVLGHLVDECPLQKVQSHLSEQMEEREKDIEERKYVHSDFKLSITQIQDRLNKAYERIGFLENENEKKITELAEMKQEHIISCNQYTAKLDNLQERVKVLETQNVMKESKLKAFDKMSAELERAKERLSNLEKQNGDYLTHTELPESPHSLYAANVEWRIQSVNDKIQNKENTFSDPFYIGLYLFQGYIRWDCNDSGRVGCFIYLMKGDFDDQLLWPFRFKLTIVLLDQINHEDNLICCYEVSMEDMEKFPNSFRRPSEFRNEAFGSPAFISNTRILENTYCNEDSVIFQISVEQLPIF
ncbi:TNF receptor-associated factor 3 isoform X1 [Oopsacas minuta]|uniref:TNF receptor-associated factor 3 isoform X1 n=1 Tax=Oopsacas minuta TaxID=111878 RepID=A0AAV7JNV1_9METZ|nr:TNF receptor-associated factor 3 isoform X1 [Oopsacas minuta]